MAPVMNRLAAVLLGGATTIVLPAAPVAAGTSTIAYVVNAGTEEVLAVDTATGTVRNRIPAGRSPSEITAAPDGTSVWVANFSPGRITKIDTATDTVAATLGMSSPRGIAFRPGGATAYVANQGAPTVTIVDTATFAITGTIDLGDAGEDFARDVVVSPNGARAYAVGGADKVYVLDLTTNSLTGVVTVGNTPRGLDISPDGRRVYVASQETSTLSVIDTATNTVVATPAVGAASRSVVATAGRVYVNAYSDEKLYVLDAATDTVVATPAVGIVSERLAITPDGSRVYLTNQEGTVTVVNTADNSVAAVLTGYSYPVGIAITRVTVPPKADLRTSVTDSPDPAPLGTAYTVGQTVTNDGPDPATGVTAQVKLTGSAATPLSATSTRGTCTIAAPIVTCTVGTLAAGATAAVTVTVEPQATGTVTATGTVAATEPDPATGNNTATTTTTVDNGLGCTVLGTAGANLLAGGSGRDVICGLGGNDLIDANGGNDTVHAGSGNDTVNAGAGNDTVKAGDGNDKVYGSEGDDTVDGGPGTDLVDGGAGTDTCANTETPISCNP